MIATIGEACGARQAFCARTRSEAASNRCSAVELFLEIAVGDCCVNHGAQLAPHRIAARRQQLSHEDRDQFFRRVDPECRGGRTAPMVFARTAGDQSFCRIHSDSKAETKADASVSRLAE